MQIDGRIRQPTMARIKIGVTIGNVNAHNLQFHEDITVNESNVSRSLKTKYDSQSGNKFVNVIQGINSDNRRPIL